MTRILAAGGTGALGSAVVAKLQTTGCIVRILSRKPAPAKLADRTEWTQANTTSGDGIADALRDVDILVNCPGDAQNTYGTDVLGVKRLAESAKHAALRHFFHMSIVGTDRLDVAGPEVPRIEEIAQTYFHGRGIPCSVLIDPPNGGVFPPATIESLRQGLGTVPTHRYGRITWADYVNERYAHQV